MDDAEFLNSLKEKLVKVDGVDVEEIEKNFQETIGGLKNKNSELFSKIKNYQSELGNLKEKVGSFDSEAFKKMQEELKEKKELEEKTLQEKGNFEALLEREKNRNERELKKWNETESQYKQRLDNIQKKYHNKLVDLSLHEELKKVNVGDKFMKFVKSSFIGKAQVEVDADGKESVVINNADGSSIPITEYVNEWKESEEAKSVIIPPQSSGAGAQGSGVKGSNKLQQLEELYKEAEKNKDAKSMMRIKSQLSNLM